MPEPLNRRSFLTATAVTLMAVTTRISASGVPPLFFDGISRSVGLQLYTLGDEPNDDLDAVFAQVAAIGYRDIELPGFYGLSPAAIKAAADRAGLVISTTHLGVPPNATPDQLTLRSEPQRIGDELSALGVSQAIMPLAPIPATFKPQPGSGDFMAALARSFVEAGQDIWKETAELLNERANALKPFGISLGYHNHNVEFAPLGDPALGNRTGWDILVDETDPELIQFEIDTGWLGASGIDPVEFLERHSGRVRWMHVKDLKSSTAPNHALAMDPAEIGAGKLDWPRILPAAYKAGIRHFYVEQEPPFAVPRMEAITRSYQYLSQLTPKA